MVAIIFQTIGILVVTIFFGLTFSRFILKERRIFTLVPLAIIIGVNSLNLLVNGLAYLIPIRSSLWIILAGMAIFSGVWFVKERNQWPEFSTLSLSKRQTVILFGLALTISLFSGLVAVKSLALDDLFIGHLPLAATIVEGNFPVMDPSLPDRPLSYHYAPDLLTANFNRLAGLPLWFGYDLQIILFSGSLFLLLFVLAYQLTKNYRASIVAAGLFLYGTGFQWLYLFTDGLPSIWKRFILGEPVAAFWSFLTYVAFPKLNTSFIHSMHNHSTALGGPIFILVLWLYFQVLKTEDKKQYWIYVITAGVFFGYLALSLETYFIIALLGLATLMIIVFIGRRWRYLGEVFSVFRDRKFFRTTLILVILTLGVAFSQGGIISTMFQDNDREQIVPVSSLKDFITLDFAPDPANLDDPATFIYLFSPEFFVQFGLPLILIIPAFIYFFRRREGESLLLAIIGGGAFLVPFLFRFPARNWEMSRFFLIAIPIFSFLVGLYLMNQYEEATTKKFRYLLILLIVLVGLSGVLSQLIFSLSSLDRFGQIGPLLMRPPPATGLDIGAYDWIKKNTTLADRFFPYDPEFIRQTGRFTPGAFLYFTFNHRNFERGLYDQLANSCSSEAVRFFKINYFYITPDFPIDNWRECLAKLKGEPVYRIENKDDFRYLYKLGEF